MTQNEAKKKLREFCKKWKVNEFGTPLGVNEIKTFDIIHNLVLLVETAINTTPKKKTTKTDKGKK